MTSLWLRTVARLLPREWRDDVLRDLEEEAGTLHRSALWQTAALVRIAGSFARAAIAEGLRPGSFSGFGRHELKDGLIIVRRAPVLSALVVVTLGVTLGASAATFSALYSMVLSPLPFPSPGTLMALWQADPATPDTWQSTSAFNYVEWRRRSTSFVDVAAAQNVSRTLTDFDDPDTPLMRLVSPNYFEVLGVAPHAGRLFRPEETVTGGPNVMLLGHQLWQRRYGGDPGVIGRTIRLDGVAHVVVGIMKPGQDNPAFGLLESPQAWLPLRVPAVGADRRLLQLLVVGRLREGVSVQDARAEMSRVSAELQREYPDTHRALVASVQPLGERLVRNARRPMWMLFVAVLCVLAAACGNVANLLLARAVTRTRDLTVRSALGASALRLAAGRLAESLTLAGLAAVLALWVASLVGGVLPSLAPPGLGLPRYAFAITPQLLLFLLAAAAATGILCGVPAAAAAWRARADETLRAGRSTGGAGERAWSRWLVTMEVTAALVLLSGAAIAVSGFTRLLAASPGFAVDRTVTFRVSIRGAFYETAATRRAFLEQALQRIAATPGVERSGLIDLLPMFDIGVRAPAWDARNPPAQGSEVRYPIRFISPGALDALGVELRGGRSIEAQDEASARPVVVMSMHAARRLFGDGPALGQRLTLALDRNPVTADVIGVVRDVRLSTDAGASLPVLYLPAALSPALRDVSFVVRSSADGGVVLAEMRRTVGEIDRTASFYLARSMAEVLAAMNGNARLMSVLLSSFSIVAAVLVALGIYGTLAYLVVSRTAELGVRRAIGASRRDLLVLVFREGLKPALRGIAAGIGISLLAARAIGPRLDLPPLTVAVLAGLSLFLILLTVLSSLLPALRASRVDPLIALRS